MSDVLKFLDSWCAIEDRVHEAREGAMTEERFWQEVYLAAARETLPDSVEKLPSYETECANRAVLALRARMGDRD